MNKKIKMLNDGCSHNVGQMKSCLSGAGKDPGVQRGNIQ